MIRFAIRLCVRAGLSALLIVNFAAVATAQSTGGRINGRLTDPSGAVIPNANVTLINEATGVSTHTQTNKGGDYAFPTVAVGTYTVEFEAPGFKKLTRRQIALDLNQTLAVNETLELGAATETVEVTSEAPLIDTSSTQLGATVDSLMATQLPLNTRDTYQLLQLQPGVMSNVGGSNTIAYGSDQPGVVSVNGSRGRANNFNVNGGDANDLFANLPTVQPSPDSIAEFRVLTNTFDAEYGRNSGAVVNVVTKSGTNEFHGNAFEFFRNSVLNAQGYFNVTKPQFQQNQFGGTLGGPIKKDRAFFFLSYEGRRVKQGIPSAQFYVPDQNQRNGDFSSVTGGFSGQIINQGVADLFNNRPGCLGALGLTTPLSTQGDTVPIPYSSILVNNQIPTPCMDQTAVALMNLYVPLPNQSGNLFQSVPNQIVNGDQGSAKFDYRLTNNQNLNVYYYINDSLTTQAFSFFQAAGANVPGFGSYMPTTVQQVNVNHVWTINNSLVNEAHFTYMRENQTGFQQPLKTNLVQGSCGSLVPASQCFNDPNNPGAGISPGLGAKYEGVPFIVVPGSFSIGNNFEGQLPQIGNSYTWADSLSKQLGTHALKFGADIRYMQFNQTLYYNVNGYFQYNSSDPNSPGLLADPVNGIYNYLPDYLLGLPYSYSQGSAQTEHIRSNAYYLFAQDSWRIRSNVTLNYGLRWELDTPQADALKHVQTFRPGQATTKYPCQLSPNSSLAQLYGSTDCSPTGPANSVFPLGLVVPGDQGIPPGMTQTYYKAWAPRIGIAWSPSADKGWLRKITGAPGTLTIKAGYGIFYNPIEQLVMEQFGAEPPFGGSNTIYYTNFNTPFVDQTGNQYPNPFNGIISPPQGTPVDWSVYRPILLYGDMQPHIRTQYSEQYNLTIQRALGRNMMMQIGYVGSQGHRLLITHDVNYGNTQSCLDLMNLSAANNDPSYTCGQNYSDNSFFIPPTATLPANFTLHLPYGGPNGAPFTVSGGPNGTPVSAIAPNGITLVGLRQYSSPFCQPLTGTGCPPDGIPVFSSIFAEDTIGNSNYNSFQAMVQRNFSRGLQFQAAYTWAKSFDYGSTFEGSLNPVDPRLSYALSEFDARQRFVFNAYWQFPVPQYRGAKGVLLNGWATSGIVTLQSGFPIRITSGGQDNELNTSFFFESAGQPNQMQAWKTQSPQSHNNYYFNPNVFSLDPNSINYLTGQPLLGTYGNTPRTVCCGPGIANVDMTLEKSTKIGERVNTLFRVDFFNLFNHTQFYNPVGDATSLQFGQVTTTRDPRLVQFAVKVSF
ncbi:MAG TPA: TonB-dependent receptor [Candidatus Binatia bacterium]|nr:TonB-dependent receptor [Candidatus Binatia bacterium]